MLLYYVGTNFPSMKGFTKTNSGYIYVFGSGTEMMNKRVEFKAFRLTKCDLLHFLTFSSTNK